MSEEHKENSKKKKCVKYKYAEMLRKYSDGFIFSLQ